MNIQLVESLVDAIQALSPEERELLSEKLAEKYNWQNLRLQILASTQGIQQRHCHQLLETDIDEIIYQMREERDEQLMVDLFPSEKQ
ncbi:MAG: hypothetical protein F6K31_15860 [Symploca sp. SIO2G7]|nr:hypothetical protein [Symploca sp. SIO2G7]